MEGDAIVFGPQPCECGADAGFTPEWTLRQDTWPYLTVAEFADYARQQGIDGDELVALVRAFPDHHDALWPGLPVADYAVAVNRWLRWGQDTLPEYRRNTPGATAAGLFGPRRAS